MCQHDISAANRQKTGPFEGLFSNDDLSDITFRFEDDHGRLCSDFSFQSAPFCAMGARVLYLTNSDHS